MNATNGTFRVIPLRTTQFFVFPSIMSSDACEWVEEVVGVLSDKEMRQQRSERAQRRTWRDRARQTLMEQRGGIVSKKATFWEGKQDLPAYKEGTSVPHRVRFRRNCCKSCEHSKRKAILRNRDDQKRKLAASLDKLCSV